MPLCRHLLVVHISQAGLLDTQLDLLNIGGVELQFLHSFEIVTSGERETFGRVVLLLDRSIRRSDDVSHRQAGRQHQ